MCTIVWIASVDAVCGFPVQASSHSMLHVLTTCMCPTYCAALTLCRLPQSNVDSGQQLLIRALRAFNAHFFQCETCQSHIAEVLAAPAAAAVRSRDDAVLWLWTVHNQVGG